MPHNLSSSSFSLPFETMAMSNRARQLETIRLVKENETLMMKYRGLKRLTNLPTIEFSQATERGMEDWLISRADQGKIQLDEVYGKEGTEGNLTYVAYLCPSISRNNPNKSHVVSSDVKALIKSVKESFSHNVALLIIIAEKPISKMGMASDDVVPSLRIQKFSFDELYVDPTNYVFAPKYKKLTKEEALQLVQKNKYDISMFPKMETNDPVAKYLDFRPGDLIMIERQIVIPISYVSKSISYRLVEQSKSQ